MTTKTVEIEDNLNEIIEGVKDELKDMAIEWIKEKIKVTISRIKEDTSGYNRHISKNLPYKKRFGRVLRSKYWKIFLKREKSSRKLFQTNLSLYLKRL